MIFDPRVLSRGRSYHVRLNHQITRIYPFSLYTKLPRKTFIVYGHPQISFVSVQ
ncbi:hypothetical protein KSS87_017725, partial [Heliosperma pusillum]